MQLGLIHLQYCALKSALNLNVIPNVMGRMKRDTAACLGREQCQISKGQSALPEGI